ncbi:MAG: hypothetical protein AAF490_06260 [Chloroflexota bacterium]
MTHSELEKDLRQMADMAGEIEDYIKSDVLFWPMGSGPRLTFGGYLMRQHRILALADSLDAAGQALLNTAVSQFNNALHEKVVRLETKVHTELNARLRQWEAFLGDLKNETIVSRGFFANGVEPRIMIEMLVRKMQTPPYRLEGRIISSLEAHDRRLRRRWSKGEFVLDPVWEEAYPDDEFWYLHGLPGKGGK